MIMFALLYVCATGLVGAGVLGSLGYLLTLTFAAVCPARRPSAPLASRRLP